MKLDKEQLKQISAFISKRGFTYYDVQLEIIDHVACKVEDLMTGDSLLNLDEAIQKTHASFGVHGFSVFEDAMKVSLQKRYLKLLMHTFLSYLKPVYLPLQAGLVYIMYLLARKFNSADLPIDITWAMAFILILVYVLNNYRRHQKYKRMLTSHMGGIVAFTVNLPFQLCLNLPNNLFDHHAGIAGIVTGIFLVVIIITFLSLQKAKQTALDSCREMEQQYQLTIGG